MSSFLRERMYLKGLLRAKPVYIGLIVAQLLLLFMFMNQSSHSFTLERRRYQQACPHIILSRQDAIRDAVWFPVGRDIFVFSAYYDQKSNQVLLMGLKSTVVNGTCQMWFNLENTAVPLMVESNLELHEELPESQGRRYAAAMFRCKSMLGKRPDYISVVNTSCSQSSNLIVVKSIQIPTSYTRKFTVCLSPIYNSFSDAHAFVEWIELNLILGAEKFIVYNHSSGANMNSILDMYTQKKIMEVVQWSLPVEEVHYFGQIAALHDCLYRNKIDSEFIVNVDIDEFIIPMQNDVYTWTELLANQSGDAFLFRNVFYKHEPGDKTILKNIYSNQLFRTTKLRTFAMESRAVNAYPHRDRSKYIVRTSEATTLMIHEVPSVTGNREVNVTVERAMLQHFRNWGGLNVYIGATVHDFTIPTKYGRQLIDSVRRVWDEMATV